MFLKLLSKNGYGSSPLTRGTLNVTTISLVLCRFIPAYAGNSLTKKLTIRYSTVHPRLRGELIGASDGNKAATGSSPLTRGTPGEGLKRSPDFRFIPAYAGNSGVLSLESVTITVHPRLRGELELFLFRKR